MKAQSSTRADVRPAANDPVLLRKDVGAIVVLTLNRPRTRNTSRTKDSSATPAGTLPTDAGGVIPASAEEVLNSLEPAPAAPAAPDEPPK